MYNLTIDLKGIGYAERSLRNIPHMCKKELNTCFGSLAEDAKAMMFRRAPFATGRLRESIDIKKIGDLTYSIGPHVPYAEEVVTGQHESLKRKSKQQAFSEIVDWLDAKGMRKWSSTKVSLKRHRWVWEAQVHSIIKHLKEEGSTPNTFIDDTAEDIWPKVKEETHSTLHDALMRELGDKFEIGDLKLLAWSR